MQEYDVTLKSLLTRRGCGALGRIAGYSAEQWETVRWHNVELSEVNTRRVDLLGETADGELIHVELQRSNDSSMLFRMAEYAFFIRREFGKWPSQFVLYIGPEPMRMQTRLQTGFLSFECRMTDIGEFDAEPLLASEHLEDNIIAILARLRDGRDAVKRILRQIEQSPPEGRAAALKELTILAGLRKLESVIGQEAAKMPILDDIMDHDLFGPAIRQGLEQGRLEGRQEGRKEGRQEGLEEGERHLLLRLIEKRFGPTPLWARQRIDTLSIQELETIGVKVLDARNLRELLA